MAATSMAAADCDDKTKVAPMAALNAVRLHYTACNARYFPMGITILSLVKR